MNNILNYQANPTPENGQILLDQHKDTIDKHIKKWSGTLPDVVIKTKAQQLALNAFKTYDPNKGAHINTHLFNHLSQLSRMNYDYQNTVKIPEHQARQFSNYHNAINVLKDQLDYTPSHEEVADYMGIPVAHVHKLARNFRKEFIESRNDTENAMPTQLINGNFDANLNFSVIMERLTPEDREKAHDLLNGMKPGAFAKKHGMRSYEVSRFKTKLGEQFKEV